MQWFLSRNCALIPFTGTCGKDNGFCATYQDNYLAWAYPGIGRAVTFMAIQGVVFLSLLLIGESGTVQSLFQMAVESTNYTTPTDECPETDVTEDNDVTTERLRVLNTAISPMETQDSLILQELRKWYGSFLAVDRLTVGIPQGECFGLLGVNGAGKTSTFKMLTGDNTISSGDAYLYGYSVKNYIKEVSTNIMNGITVYVWYKICLAIPSYVFVVVRALRYLV